MRNTIRAIIEKAIGNTVPVEVVPSARPEFGHYATPVALRLAKEEGKNPLVVAEEIVAAVLRTAPQGFFERAEAAPPGFVNFWLTHATLQRELKRMYGARKKYGKSAVGKGKTVIVEYSQPNVAKPMHVGHIRTTIIGDALANIYEMAGYKVVRWNYIGDWGTQFGKLIVAYKLWGDKEKVERDPMKELVALYVRFHDEVKNDASLEPRAREEFLKLERGDRENRRLWTWFKRETVKALQKIYKTLNIRFDVWIGEAFYEDKLPGIVKDLLERSIAERSEGAVIVRLDKFNLPPVLIQKSDGGSLYHTRDIANLEYRMKAYKPAKILYVVGNEQTLHFAQLFALAKIMWPKTPELEHVKYGLVLGEGGQKLSTREGKVILLEDVLEKAVRLAREVVEEKNTTLSPREKDTVARIVGIGALKYNDLREHKHTDIVFDWDRMLDFSGDSGPYLQYTFARLTRIKKKAGIRGRADVRLLEGADELALIRKLLEFPDIVLAAADQLTTNNIAAYLYELAVLANKFYETTPVLKDGNKKRRNARLMLTETVCAVLARGLGLLGIEAPKEI